ncbi:MAG: hypothetical protein KAS66_02000 [Candidatus Omnitrophica bacterium]|nr:hypothetical protein [Candidatus Omnitrophota bacterium]
MGQYNVEIESEVTNDKNPDKRYGIRVSAITESAESSVDQAVEMMRLAKIKAHNLQHQKLE